MPGAAPPQHRKQQEPVSYSSQEPDRRSSIWAATPIVIVYWVSGIVLNYSNASILHAVPCPALLCSFQMMVTALLVQPAKCLAPDAGQSPDISSILFRVVPASILLATSIVVDKQAHGVLSLGVIHLMGCSQPVLTYLMSCCAGMDSFACSKTQALLIIYVGVAVASGSFTGYTPMGLLMYVVVLFSKCGNVLLLGVLLSTKGLKLDPFRALSFHAAVSCVCLGLVGAFVELPEDTATMQAKFSEDVGFGALLLNGANFFVMQLSVLILIYRTDAVTFMVFSLIRGMVMDGIGALAFGQPCPIEELVGYMLALIGVQVFNLVRNRPEDFGTIGSLVDGLLKSTQGMIFEVSSATQRPSAKALANKKAFNNELDDELDSEMQLPVSMVGARGAPPPRRDAPSTRLSTEFFEIGDGRGEEEDQLLSPTG